MTARIETDVRSCALPVVTPTTDQADWEVTFPTPASMLPVTAVVVRVRREQLAELSRLSREGT